jgi:hypothetical protein
VALVPPRRCCFVLETLVAYIRANSAEREDSSKFPHAAMQNFIACQDKYDTREHFRSEDKTLTARLLGAQSDSKEDKASAKECENNLLGVQAHLAHLEGALSHFHGVESASIEEHQKNNYS